jgi:PAS domain S-box-containing protein
MFESIDLTVLVNLLLSLTIVIVSIWGYLRIGKLTPLYFGIAYILFALSHLAMLTGSTLVAGLPLILMRSGGYLLVAVGLFALIRDIIERQRAEQALRESEERLCATFDQTAVGIVEFLPDERICRCNRRFAEILGCTEDKLLATPIWDIVPPDDSLWHLDAINRVLMGDYDEYCATIPLVRKDGAPIWCQSYLSSVRDADTKPKYFILVLEDITARKLAEEELATLNTGLENRVQERTHELEWVNSALLTENRQRSLAEDQLKTSLHEKEVLLREIHHRVKNNLQIIISLLYLQASKTENPGFSEALMESQTRVRSMALIHEKLYQSDNLSSIDFEGYLKNLVANLMVSYGVDRSRVRINIAVADLPMTINTAIPLGLIMNELVSNALKYAFPEGSSGEVSIRGSMEGDTILLRVRDTGRGIPENFDWKHAESLGLNLVQMLIRQLKGTIDLSRNAGTEFTISVPARGTGVKA